MPETADRLINQRYAVVRLLGEGGMGSVYLVRDTYEGDRQVALKFLRPDGLDAESIEMFKDEFRSMASLRHPNLAEVYDFGATDDDGRPFLTMEYMKGDDLARVPRRQLLDRFDDLAVQSLRALDYIHSRGLLHNDIKPQNIMIHPPFQVKLLDFGLARGQADTTRPRLSGTLQYIAPERFGDTTVDARSDLYSLGVVLYEVLTGSLPHQGDDLSQVVGAILRGDVTPPREIDPTIPTRQETFLMALLSRDRDRRPPGAAAAIELLNTGRAEPLRLDTPETCASFVTSGRLVGRDDELNGLMRIATEHAQGPAPDDDRARLVLLIGPAGIGKSRLLRELKHRLQLAGILNVTGHCYKDGGVPFQPFVEVLRQLPAPVPLPPALVPVLNQLVPSGAQETNGTPAVSEKIGKEEFIRNLARALTHLAAGRRGVIFLEDLHWSDGPGLDLLDHMLLRPDPGPWLLVGSMRDDAPDTVALEAFRKRLSSTTRVRRMLLNPLDPEQVVTLIASMVPFEDRPEGLARILTERTSGNPLYLEELMKSLAEEGTLRRRGRAWVAESRALDTIRLPASLASVVVQRLANLSVEDRLVADTLAVLNRPASVDLLTPASGLTRDRVEEAIEALERLRFVTEEAEAGGRTVIRLSHGRVREAIYQDIPEARRRAMHLAVGRAIEAAHASALDAVAEELAYHFSAADERVAAADYSLRAADKAVALYYPQRQVQFLTQTLEFLPEDDSARRLRVLSDLSVTRALDLGDHEGSLRDARILYEEARRARDSFYEAASLREMAWNLGFLGHQQEAVAHGRRALALARANANRRQEMWTLNTLGMLYGRQRDHTTAAEQFELALRISESLNSTEAFLTICNNAALNFLGMGETPKALRILEDSLGIARKNGLDFWLHRNLTSLGVVRYDAGDLDGAIRATGEALGWAREHLHSEIIQHGLENMGLFLSQAGRFDGAWRALEEARSLRLAESNPSILLPNLDIAGWIQRDLGRTQEAKNLHREGLDLARRLVDRVQEGFFLGSLATDLLREGALDNAESSAREALQIGRELQRPRIVCRAQCVLTRVAAGRKDRRALATALRALTRIDARPLLFHDRLLLHLTIGRSALEAGRPSDAEREARAGLAAAEKAGMREFQWRFNVLMGDARSARRLPDDAAGFYNVARRLIQETASEIEDTTMRKDYENDGERRDMLSRTGLAGGLPTAREAAGAAKGDPVKMLTTLYQITQIINSILDLKELLDKVMDLAIDLVGAERGLVFLYRPETDEMEMVVARNMEHQTIKDATEYSRSILREVGQGRPILSHDALSDDRFKEFRSVSVYNIRSLLCVPLKLRNRIIGTVYADTRKPGVIFTDDDLRFLETFANQAAIAIENARLYEQARQENQYLRQAVQERYGYENLIGRSPRMREVFSLLTRIAPSNLPAMIRGESGTGKELVARAIHHNSPRRDRKFFTENCAALPDTLLESELFGHARGAFTGADTSRRGLFELADGGTLFLDEVGDMSMPMQSKLLRVLQDGEFRPVGSETPRHVDVRVISATSRDLESMIRQKTFREDLYFRLKVITVKMPPLRERREDIPLLVDHFLGKIASENKTPKLRIDRELNGLLSRYDWPGNVRELENEVYRLALFATGDTLTLQDAQSDPEFISRITLPGTRGVDTGVTSEDLERALAQANGNRDQAARILGVSRATFFRKLKQFQIAQKRPRLVRPPHSA